MFKKILLLILLISSYSLGYSQINRPADSLITTNKKIVRMGNEMRYDIGDGKVLVYSKPCQFGFIRDLPKDAAGIASTAFKKESVKPWLVIAGSTAIKM